MALGLESSGNLEDSKENLHCDLMSVGVNVNFGALKNQSECWKSRGKVLEICFRKWVRTLCLSTCKCIKDCLECFGRPRRPSILYMYAQSPLRFCCGSMWFWSITIRSCRTGIPPASESLTTAVAQSCWLEFKPCIFVFQFFWAIGSVFTVAVAMAVMPTLGWRWLLGFLSLPLLFFVLMSYVSTCLSSMKCSIRNRKMAQ